MLLNLSFLTWNLGKMCQRSIEKERSLPILSGFNALRCRLILHIDILCLTTHHAWRSHTHTGIWWCTRSTCPLPLAIFFGLYPIFPYLRVQPESRHTVLESNQVAPTSRRALYSIIFTTPSRMFRCTLQILPCTRTLKMWQHRGQPLPPRAFYEAERWVSRSPKANRRPLCCDPPHRPGELLSIQSIPDPVGYSISVQRQRPQHPERRPY